MFSNFDKTYELLEHINKSHLSNLAIYAIYMAYLIS